MPTRLRERAGGIPVTAACTAAVEAPRALGVSRLALVHPPWFDEELAAGGAAFFGAQGFEVVLSEAAEAALHRPVATANQCLPLAPPLLAGARERPSGDGRLLSEDGP